MKNFPTQKVFEIFASTHQKKTKKKPELANIPRLDEKLSIEKTFGRLNVFWILCYLYGVLCQEKDPSITRGHGTRWVRTATCLNRGIPVLPKLEFGKIILLLVLNRISLIFFNCVWAPAKLRVIFITEKTVTGCSLQPKLHLLAKKIGSLTRKLNLHDSQMCNVVFQFWVQKYPFKRGVLTERTFVRTNPVRLFDGKNSYLSKWSLKCYLELLYSAKVSSWFMPWKC